MHNRQPDTPRALAAVAFILATLLIGLGTLSPPVFAAPPDPGTPATTGPNPTSDPSPTWTWTDSTGFLEYKVKIGTTPGGEEVLAPTSVGTANWWVTDLDPSLDGPQGFSDGTYYLSVQAVGADGASNWVTSAPLVVDVTKPQLTQVQPAVYVSTTLPTSMEIAFNDGTGTGFQGIMQVRLDTQGNPGIISTDLSPHTTTGLTSGALTGTIQIDLSSGLVLENNRDYALYLTVWDLAGNGSVLQSGFLADTRPPFPPESLQILWSPTRDTTPTVDWPLAYDGPFGTIGSGVASYKIGFYANGQLVGVLHDTAETSWTVPDAEALASGTYEVRVWSVDGVNNVSVDYISAPLVVDATPPEIQIISPASGGTFDQTTSSTILARVTGQDQVRVVVDNGPEVEPTSVQNNGLLFHVLRSPLTAGEHTVRIKAVDWLGNASESAVTFTVVGRRRGFGIGRFRFEPAPPNP